MLARHLEGRRQHGGRAEECLLRALQQLLHGWEAAARLGWEEEGAAIEAPREAGWRSEGHALLGGQVTSRYAPPFARCIAATQPVS